MLFTLSLRLELPFRPLPVAATSFNLVYVCVHVECVCLPVYVCVSQCTEVMAGPGLLAKDLAAPVAAHLPVAASVPVSVSAVRSRHQTGQEAFGPARQALPAASTGVTIRPSGADTVPPRGPHRRLQQLVGAVLQGGRELQVDAVKHHSAGLGLWLETEKVFFFRSISQPRLYSCI